MNSENTEQLNKEIYNYKKLFNLISNIFANISDTSVEQTIQNTVKDISNLFPDLRVVYSTMDNNNRLKVIYSIEPDRMLNLEGLNIDLKIVPEYVNALKSFKPIIIPNVHEDERLKSIADTTFFRNVESALNISLKHSDDLIGILSFDSPKRREWSDYEIEILTEITKYLTIALRNISIQQEKNKKNDRMKTEFISTINHELRTPLTSIIGALGLISGGAVGEIPKQVKELIDIAYRNSEHLHQLINDVLDIEKLESNEVRFNIKQIDLIPIIEKAIESSKLYAEKFNVKIIFDKPLDNIKLNADSDRLMQVLTNLISNAIKFSYNSSTVKISIFRNQDKVRVSVIDNGIGIPEEFKDRIFQKFAQVDSSATRKRDGTGLGLSICKAIIEKLGGEIGYESKPNVETTFYFELPSI